MKYLCSYIGRGLLPCIRLLDRHPRDYVHPLMDIRLSVHHAAGLNTETFRRNNIVEKRSLRELPAQKQGPDDQVYSHVRNGLTHHDSPPELYLGEYVEEENCS